METRKQTPRTLFGMPQNFVVPLFQRKYVWKQAEQWEPLWQDIRRIADFRLANPGAAPEHFLGAIVLQAQVQGTNTLTAWNVIDGQQRLTTLQLLTDAAAGVLSQFGYTQLSGQLEALTHNPSSYVGEGDDGLKVIHLNTDREAFVEVMEAEFPVDYPSLVAHETRISAAHEYFVGAVSQWLAAAGGEGAVKAEQLTHVLSQGLQLVSIELGANENSQEIFETLNARGTPLTAADLVRNFVFQRLEAEGGDIARAHATQWPFESRFWEAEVSVGRYLISRSSLFLNQWLVSRTGEEIGPQATFARFKSYVEHQPSITMGQWLPVIKAQADLYRAWTEAADTKAGALSATEMAVYRMRAGGVEVLKPLLIWLHEPGRNVPAALTDRAIAAAESWVVRRQLLRLPSADLGRALAVFINEHLDDPADELVSSIVEYLTGLDTTSTYWPGDEEVRAALQSEAMYRRFPRARLRMYLEAVENSLRAETGQPQIERAGFPIEHILPQKWTENWPVEVGGEIARQERVHRLGNLTLLTGPLNSKVSNAAWDIKRRALLEHNTIKLTGRLVELTEAGDWDNARIDRRTDQLIDALLRVWPVPAGHVGAVADPQFKAQDTVKLSQLVAAGLLERGTKLTATHRDFVDTEAFVTDAGSIAVEGREFATPSGAARSVRKRSTNGWVFWALADGRRLGDVRTEFIGGAHG